MVTMEPRGRRTDVGADGVPDAVLLHLVDDPPRGAGVAARAAAAQQLACRRGSRARVTIGQARRWSLSAAQGHRRCCLRRPPGCP
jgi:hypothetical protein